MSEPIQPEEDIISQNKRSLSILIRAIARSQNRFSLILVRCNYTFLREQILEELRQRSELQIEEIKITPDKSETNLYTTIMTTAVTDDLSATSVPKAVMVSGLECVTTLDDLLISMNRVRNDFLRFPFPLVFWINDEVLQKFIRLAPDFYTYAGVPIKFAPATNELVHFLQDEADSLFTQILEAGADQFLDNAIFNLEMGAGKRFEIESALQELDSRGCSEPKLKASQQFILGRDAYDNDMERSRQLYEESLAFWQQGNNNIHSSPYIQQQACLLFHLGLWWRRRAVLHRAKYKRACGRAQNYYQQCVDILQQANCSDLAAKFINSLAEVLQQLEQWDKLETVAKKAIKLHTKHFNDIRLANAYAFLAEIALEKRNWRDAQRYAETALTIIEQQSALSSSPENRRVQQYYQSQSWYHLLIAKAQKCQGQLKEALQNLETAKEECKPDYHPQRYTQILDALHKLYYEQHRYLEAVELKQEKSSIEQQYGFRAFIGVGQLQSQREVLNPDLGPFYNGAVTAKTQQGTIAQEIIASGREQDVHHLIERISRDDKKLIIIYGPSGVGKSSLLTAGLVPELKNRTAIDSRNPLPVIVRFYSDWVRELGKALLLATPQNPSPVESQELSSQQEIFQQLRRNADSNFLTILIFDQFEEFFLNCSQPAQRKEFWQFLKVCLDDSLNLPYIKVVFSIRQDCLSHLLDGNRLVNLEVTNNDILNKNILYYLGNFSPDIAKNIIEILTQRSSSLNSLLIERLVRDLAEEQGEVRPIELQIVGAQLETEKITTLEEYEQKGPKEQLVQRFLEQVVRDCGQEDERIAQLVLYFLTDENDTRPLKTRAELLAKLEDVLPTESGTLELVLEILVKSGIVFLIPQSSTDYYQLVHDYLVSFIRQQRGAELYTELKTEKQKRQLAETQRLKAEAQQLKAQAQAQRLKAQAQAQQLKAQAQAQQLKAQAQAQQLKAQAQAQRSKIFYGVVIGLVVLIAVGVVSVKSKIGEINAQLSAYASSSARLFVANLHEEALIESIKGGEQLQQPIWANWVEADTKTLVNTALRQAVYESFGKELETLGLKRYPNKMHSKAVRSVSFSPDGKIIASASDDNTVKLWYTNSDTEPKTLKGHSKAVKSVSFSPDGKMIASASSDKTVKLWDTSTGKEIKTLKGHEAEVMSVSFSPDGKTIASASSDKTVKLWDTSSGKELKTLKGNSFALWSVRFRPNHDGKTIAAASSNGKVMLWDTSTGKELKTLERHSSDVWDISFSHDGKMIASVSRDGTVKLWSASSGEELKTLKGNSFALSSVSFSRDDNIIAAASWDGTIILWDTFSGKKLKTLKGHEAEVRSVSFSPDGKMIASASDDKTVKLWDVSHRKAKTLFSQHDTNKRDSDKVRSVSFSPNGKMIAFASDGETINKDGTINKNGTIILRDISTGKELNRLKGHTAPVWGISFSPKGEMIASASWDGTIKLWNTSTGEELKTPSPMKHKAEVWSVSFSPDGTKIASASSDKTVKLWNTSTDEKLKTPSPMKHTAEVRSVSFSPDGTKIASASSDKVKLWNTSTGKELKTPSPMKHTAEVRSVSFSPDGKTIASASSDKTVKLWDTSSGKELKTLQGHTADVWDVNFSPDGKTIASASSDKTVKLWDTSSGTQITTLKGHTADVWSVSFSHDGKMMTSASDDKTVIVWNLDTDNLLKLGCEWLKNNPSQNDKKLPNPQVCQQTSQIVAHASVPFAQGKEIAPASELFGQGKQGAASTDYSQKVLSARKRLTERKRLTDQTGNFSCNPGSGSSPGLFTYVVKALDNRVGSGIRCVKFSDGGGHTIPFLAWYGEGSWGGKTYRHVGHAFYKNGGLIGYASNIYGNGENIKGNYENLKVQIVDQSTIRVTGAWNEEWKLVSSTNHEPLSMSYTTCGGYFDEYRVSDLKKSRQGGGLRCILRVGLRVEDPNTTWFGNGNWEDTEYTHLGTLSSKGYGADDICNTAFCNTFEYGLLKLNPNSDNPHDFDVTGAWSEKWQHKNEKFQGR